jgi:hypothetical protein
MTTKVLTQLPGFDTGQYEGVDFLMPGGRAILTIHVRGLDAIGYEFQRVRWHEFTALYSCTAEQIAAYFKLVEVLESERLARYVSGDRAPARAYRELHHYRIFLDETGCHELFAESWAAV